MLKRWNHPRTSEPRLYISPQVVEIALERSKLELPISQVKAFVHQEGEKGPGDYRIKVQTEQPLDAELRNEFSKHLVRVLEIPSGLTWKDLLSQAENEGNYATGVEDASRTVSPSSIQSERSRLPLEKIRLPYPATIEMSTRESGLLEMLLGRHPDLEVTRAVNSLAGLRVQNQVGTELLVNRIRCNPGKSGTSDLQRGLVNDELFRDAERVLMRSEESDHTVIPVIVLEGNWRASSLKASQMDGLEAFLVGAKRLSVLTSADIDSSVYLIVKLIKQILQEPQRPPRHAHKPSPLVDQKLYTLASLPGVSDIIAEALLRHFGSVAKAMNADESELSQVKGIGGRKAREIAKVLGTGLFD